MRKTMTPSEIAEWLDQQNEPWTIQAAATIRELEASNKARADIIYAQTKSSEIDRDKLKIATEALEGVRDGASEVALITIADQALTRIEDMG